MSIEAPVMGSKQYDLVILAFPVWFLSCAQPLQAFLHSSHARVLKERPIVALIACRELWHEGLRDLKRRLEPLQARLIDEIVVKEPMSSLLSYIVTPLYLITGFKLLRRDDDNKAIELRLKEFGKIYSDLCLQATPLPSGVLEKMGSAPINTRALATEIVGHWSFHLWATAFIRFAPPHTLRRHLAICGFFLYLLAVIPVMKLSEGLVQLLAHLVCPERWQRYVSSLRI